MDETKQNSFNGWAKVEVMGHQSHIGYVTTEVYGAACMFRIDQPAIPEGPERTLERDAYINGKYINHGSIVRDSAVPGCSVLVGSGSIYRITPCTEEVAIHAIRNEQPRALMIVRMPEAVALPSGAEEDDEDEDEDDLNFVEEETYSG